MKVPGGLALALVGMLGCMIAVSQGNPLLVLISAGGIFLGGALIRDGLR